MDADKLRRIFRRGKDYQYILDLETKITMLANKIEKKKAICSSYDVLKDEKFLSYLKNSDNIVLDDTDLDFMAEYLLNENAAKKFESIKDFVGVHKTSYSPKNDTIHTPNNTGAKRKEIIELYGNKYEINYKCANNSVHFAVNGPVGDHMYGSWANRDLAVITPIINCKNNKMMSYRTEDTYAEGNFNLGDNSFCLCPIERRDEILRQNKSLKVICYDKNKISLDKEIEVLLCYLGYKVEVVSAHEWVNDCDVNSFYKILRDEKSGLGSIKSGTHIHSHQYLEVFMNENIYRLVEILKCIRDNCLDVQFSVEDLKKITKKRKTLGEIDLFSDTLATVKDIENYVYKLIKTFAEEGFYLPDDTINYLEGLKNYLSKYEGYASGLGKIFDQINLNLFCDFLFHLGFVNGHYDEAFDILNDNKRKK